MNSKRNSPAHAIMLKLIKDIRLERGLRQQELAERLNVPQSFVSKYESGERRLDLLELKAICLSLGLTLAEFVRRLEEQLEHITLGENNET